MSLLGLVQTAGWIYLGMRAVGDLSGKTGKTALRQTAHDHGWQLVATSP